MSGYNYPMPIYRKDSLLTLTLGNFLSRFHHFLIGFIVAAFLSQFMSYVTLGFVIAAASAATAISLLLMPEAFTRFGTKRVLILLALIEIVVLVGLARADNGALAGIFLALQGMCAYNMFLGLDLLLQSHTIDAKQTGHLRGIFLASANFAVLIASLSLGLILTDHNYRDVFYAAALSLIPFALLSIALPNISHAPGVPLLPERGTVKEILARADVLPTMAAHFLLLLSFTWFNFYIPLLLYVHNAFSWQTTALIITISLLPSILIEYPLGVVADMFFGEKEISMLGFLLMAGGTIGYAFAGSSVSWWIIVVLIAGIGESSVEIATESHFFKRVSVEDAGIIGAFRMLRPLAAIVGPLIASIALLLVPFNMIFVVFGTILCLGIPLIHVIVDTK